MFNESEKKEKIPKNVYKSQIYQTAKSIIVYHENVQKSYSHVFTTALEYFTPVSKLGHVPENMSRAK